MSCNASSPHDDGEHIQPSRHTTFYMEDGNVHLRVGSVLFKVHRYFLIRESAFFKDMFALPQAGPENVEGLSDENAILLPDTTQAEIYNLFSYLYFGMRDDYKPTDETWTHLLSIATRLLFDDIRRHAITRLTFSGLRPLNRVLLALKYDIEQWLRPAYEQIVRDRNSLSFEDASLLPWAVTTMLLRAREIYHRSDNFIPPPNPPTLTSAAASNSNGSGSIFGLFASPVDTTHKLTANAIITKQLELLKKYQDASANHPT